jgi:hypothetical protein
LAIARRIHCHEMINALDALDSTITIVIDALLLERGKRVSLNIRFLVCLALHSAWVETWAWYYPNYALDVIVVRLCARNIVSYKLWYGFV